MAYAPVAWTDFVRSFLPRYRQGFYIFPQPIHLQSGLEI